MKKKIYSLFLAALLGVWGMQAWALDQVDGVYQIGTAEDLVEFATLVNGGEVTANAVLTADIDLTGVEWTPIGNGEAQYTGTFDGQGHAITNFEYEATDKYNGLFGYVNGGTVKNFSISGTLTSSFDKNGVVGNLNGSAVVSGIHSSLTINVSECKAHSGGIVGGCETNCSPLIEGCEYSGTLTHSGLGDCQAGIVGYTYGGTIRNCIFSGTIIGESNKYGGILGYCKVTSFGGVQNCLSIGKIVADEGCTTAAAIIANWNGDATANVKNNYYCLQEGSTTTIAIGNKKENCEVPVQVTPEQLASGEVAYLLNGSKSTDVVFYQTLPGDTRPTLDATHGIVYMNGRLHCNGDVYEGSVYSNENTDIIQDDHNFVDGFCSYCGLFDESYMTPNADGFYEIGTAAQLKWFAALVKAGHPNINAILTNDIDLSVFATETDAITWKTPIGTSAVAFTGIFDGQGHQITGFAATSTGRGGFFGVIENATIQDFSIAGTLAITGGKYSGAIGSSKNSTISGVNSGLTITVTGEGTGHVGGVVGSTEEGSKSIITKCSFTGNMSVGIKNTNNFAGVVGYLAGDSVANCANYGTVTFDDAGCAAGGVVGYINNTSVYIRECLNIGDVVCTAAETPTYGGAIVGRIKKNWSSSRVKNNYWLEGSAYGPAKNDDSMSLEAASAEGSTTSEMASGEITWLLNKETFFDVVWRQTIGEEEYPVLMGDGAIVYKTSSEYMECVSDDIPGSVEAFCSDIISQEQEFVEDPDLIAYQALIDDYNKEIESWKEINNLDDFLAAYKASAELKQSIKQSAANYAKYIDACENARSELETQNPEGLWANMLKTYLNEENAVEPGSDYPNGSYAYIMANRDLDDEAIIAETAFVRQMLQNAIAGGITAGTEITLLMTNPTFANGFEGWTTEADGISLVTGGKKEIMPIARGLKDKNGNGTFNVSQSLTEMPNGIYLMEANGLFRACDDINSTFYAGQLYLNNTVNYFMSPGEDVISDDAAEPGVNCLGEGTTDAYYDDGEIVTGWVPNGIEGCSVAFSADRYQNFCAAEVTDGNLTIGVRSLGTGQDGDWLPFGNLHVTYLGTADEAKDELKVVLKAYAKRAKVIVNFQWEDYEGVGKKPNMSEELKGELTDAIAEAENATTGEEEMALINRFSQLFNETHDCRKAYIAMWKASEKTADLISAYADLGIISEDEYYEYEAEYLDAQEHYGTGDLSAAEAWATVKRLNEICQVVPIEDGVYQIATAEHLRLFSIIANSVEPTAKAVLTADIDMTDVEDFEPIGSSSQPFSGEFDGQGHKITNFGQFIVDEETGEGYYTLSFSTAKKDNRGGEGFFGMISGATVKNFSIDGTFEVTGGHYKGTIGQSWKSTVSNVHSAINIAITTSGCNHCGGLIGSSEGGSGSTITNCSYSGTLTIADGSTNNFAGILGYSTGDDAVRNCANYGTINFTSSGCAAGGIVGYINNKTTSIQNCLNVGSVHCTTSDSPKYGGAIVGRIKTNWGASVIVNNYWLAGSAYAPAKKDDGSSPAAASATGETAEQLASGEVCYALNGDQTEINWFQTLGEDEHPILFSDHKQVFFDTEKGYYNEAGNITGDVNGDGAVDIADVVKVLSFMAESATADEHPEADVNGDKAIDIADVVKVLSIMAEQ